MMPTWVGLTLLSLASWGLTDLLRRAWRRWVSIRAYARRYPQRGYDVDFDHGVAWQYEMHMQQHRNRVAGMLWMLQRKEYSDAVAEQRLWQLFQATKREAARG